MIARFREIDRAINFLLQGLESPKPEVRVELVWYPHGQMLRRHEIVPCRDVRRVLGRWCRHFPEVVVAIDVPSSPLLFGALQCRCVGHRCELWCLHLVERPLACAIVNGIGERRLDEVALHEAASSAQKHIRLQFEQTKGY